MTQLMLATDMQRSNEQMFSRKFIDKYIDKAMRESEFIEAKVEEGIELLRTWTERQDVEHEKRDRLNQVSSMDLEMVVRAIFIQTAYCQRPEPITAVIGQLAPRLGFADRAEAILTASEMVAVVCETDAYNIDFSESSDVIVVTNMIFSEELQKFITQSRYLPPMVCQPQELTHNKQSAYLTHSNSLILGKGNHHDGCISLDVLNTQNSIPLSVNTDFLSTVEEDPTFDLSDPAVRDQWTQYKLECYELYLLMAKQGNKFYLTNKVDKRGRIYSQGYHITLQGTAFKKATLDLYDKEIVEGVPGIS